METPIYTEKTRQFILDTLLPYKENPELCAISSIGNCVYLTEDGKKCAVGKHMKEGEWQKSEEIFIDLIKLYPKELFLTEEALSYNLTNAIWLAMQEYHDSLSIDDKVNSRRLEELTGLKFPELEF